MPTNFYAANYAITMPSVSENDCHCRLYAIIEPSVSENDIENGIENGIDNDSQV